jgi:hypothetical protein
MQRLDLRVGAGVLHAPFAGSILDADRVIPLVVRFNMSAITADGRLISIDRPSEWPDQTFPSWIELQLQRMGADQMAAACSLVEHMLDLPYGILSAESLKPALAVAAACCSGSLLQLQLRLNPWTSIQPV